MDMASGVFTAPVSGRYQFNFVALNEDEASTVNVLLRLNEGTIAQGHGHLYHDTVAMTATVSLQKNDRIDTYLVRGLLFDNGDHYTQFTGILLEEDLVLS